MFLGIKIAFWSFGHEFRPLVSDLNPEQTVKLSNKLYEEKVVVKYDTGRNIFYVDINDFHKARDILKKLGFLEISISSSSDIDEDGNEICEEQSKYIQEFMVYRPLLGALLIAVMMVGVVRPVLVKLAEHSE